MADVRIIRGLLAQDYTTNVSRRAGGLPSKGQAMVISNDHVIPGSLKFRRVETL